MSFILLVLTLLLTMGVNMALAVRLTSTRAEQHAR